MMKYEQGAQNGYPARPQRAQRRDVRFGTLSLYAKREQSWKPFSTPCLVGVADAALVYQLQKLQPGLRLTAKGA